MCTTKRVETVAEQNRNAAQAIKSLHDDLQDRRAFFETTFNTEMDRHLKAARVTDPERGATEYRLVTSYSSEFNLDAVADVVKSAAKAAVAGYSTGGISPVAMESYIDLVDSVAEAAKSSSAASADLTFSMARLAPGVFGFLYATSGSLRREDLFGHEAISTTAFFYRFVRSIADKQNEEKFRDATHAEAMIRRFRDLQIAVMDDLDAGKLDPDAAFARIDLYETKVSEYQKRLDEAGWKTAAPLRGPAFLESAGPEAEKTALLQRAIANLAERGGRFADLAERQREKLVTGYFGG